MTQTAHTAPARIAFIGGGNMARSLIAGLLRNGTPADDIHVAEPVAELRQQLAADFGVHVHAQAQDAAGDASVWVLAVKPQVMREVCTLLAPLAHAKPPLVLSIAAGITATQLLRWLGQPLPLVRAMPNTPALLGAGITGLFATATSTAGQRARAEQIMASAGRTVWVEDESLMDAVTAVSGSGPAYVFLLAEAMAAAARQQGLSADTAHALVVETLLGASRMLSESGESPAELRRRVTSPGGTTQAAVETFQAGGFEPLVEQAINAAAQRGKALSAAND